MIKLETLILKNKLKKPKIISFSCFAPFLVFMHKCTDFDKKEKIVDNDIYFL